MDQSTAEAIGAVVGLISLPVAVASAAFAWWAGRAAARSARAAEQQNQLGHADRLGSWQPSVDMVLDEVTFRWATREDVREPGDATDPGLSSTDAVSPGRAERDQLHVEVVVSGSLVNHTGREMLATAHALHRRRVRYPLQNQGVFLIDGEDRDQTVIAANATAAFRWIDRRPMAEWLLHRAVSDQRPASEDQVRVPRPREHHRSSGGFRVVLDSRAAERVSEVWTALLERSPIRPAGRDQQDELLWGLAESASGPIDDDVVRYRCAADGTLAQLEPSGVRWVPGRL